MSRKQPARNRNPEHAPAAPCAKPPWGRLSVAVAVLAVALGIFWSRDSATSLCRQARASLASDPLTAERLAERSIAAALGPYPEADLLRCRALGALGKWTEAIGGFSLIAHPEQCPPADMVDLGRAAAAADQWLLASLALQAAKTAGATGEGFWRLSIVVNERRGDFAAVLADCESLAQAEPRDPFPWQVRARVHQQRGELVPAIHALREALARPASELEEFALRTLLVEGLLSVGEIATARVELDRLLQQEEIPPALHVKNAFLLRMEGSLEPALAEVDRALESDPQSPQALFLRGMLHLDLGAAAAAAADLERALAINPYNKEAHYKLAEAYRRLNRQREADEHLARSQELTAWRLEVLQQLERATVHPDDREVKRRLAELYESVGEPEPAARWRRAAEASPH